jgi:tetratricopeptide (TPR) repeat protein
VEANTHYDKAEYKQAVAIYEEILSAGYHAPEVYYNAGNSYLKLGLLAKAVLNYERAIKLNPSDKRIFHMLSLAREAIDSDIVEVQDFVLIRYWKKFSQVLSPLGWVLVQIVCGMVLIVGFYYWKFSDSLTLKRNGLLAFSLGVIILVLSFLAGAKSEKLINGKDGAIVMEAASLMSGPDARSGNLNQLREGEKVIILDKIDTWYKVQLMNKEEGWLEAESMEII